MSDALGFAAARLDHVAVAVRSIAAVRGFYELLGLRVAHEDTIAHEQVKTAMLAMGESRLELLEPMTAESVVGRFLAERGEGMHHVALRVEDVDARFREMQAAGVRLASDQVRVGAGEGSDVALADANYLRRTDAEVKIVAR